MNILEKRRDLPFSRKSNRKKEESTVCFTHEQNIICRSRGGVSTNEKKEKFASNDK